MAKVVITLEDNFESGAVDFNIEMPELKSEDDVTTAVVIAMAMIETATKFGEEDVEEE